VSSANHHLSVDYKELGELDGNLVRALTELRSEFISTAELALAVGDGNLSGRVVSFGTSWNDHRLSIIGNLDWLQKSVHNIQDQLEKVDTQLSEGLQAPAVQKASRKSGSA
jgi:hypothetical protein